MTRLALPAVDSKLLAQATELLLAPAALEFRQLSDVLAGIHVHHVDYADLYFQYSRMESWSLEEGIVKSGSFSIDRGVGVRAVSGEKTAFAYSDDITLDALTKAATATRAIGRQGQSAVAALDKLGSTHVLYSPSDPVAALQDVADFGKLKLALEALELFLNNAGNLIGSKCHKNSFTYLSSFPRERESSLGNTSGPPLSRG